MYLSRPRGEFGLSGLERVVGVLFDDEKDGVLFLLTISLTIFFLNSLTLSLNSRLDGGTNSSGKEVGTSYPLILRYMRCMPTANSSAFSFP